MLSRYGNTLISEVEILQVGISLCFLLATIFDEEVVKTKTSFLIVLDIKLSNNPFCCDFNI